MTTTTLTPGIDPKALFNASCIALITTAMTFAIRAGMINTLGAEFQLTDFELGLCVGTAFWGFTLAQLFGGALVDGMGMATLLRIAFVGHALGVVLTIFASGFWSLFGSTLLVGLANGFVEAACNPLVTALYPKDQTKMLNRFHMWFPGGIVIGAVLSYFLNQAGLNWQVQMATILLPTLVYGILFLGKKFPVTLRVTSGVTYQEMLAAVVSPLFLFMVACMLLTAATELGTGQWIDKLLTNAGVSAILVLAFINGIMAIGRSMAGELVHRLAPHGMLLFSAVFATLGLYALSMTTSPFATFGAAAVFAIGICYFWPTMLGFVAEYVPKSGALGMNIMGATGMLSVAFVLPLIGQKSDQFTAEAAAKAGTALETLKAATTEPLMSQWQQVQLASGSETLRFIALMPAVLVVAFLLLNIAMRRGKGTVS